MSSLGAASGRVEERRDAGAKGLNDERAIQESISSLARRLWRKQTREGVRHTVVVTRLYKNGDVWKESSRFGRDDIPVMRLALDEAHTWIYQHPSGPAKS